MFERDRHRAARLVGSFRQGGVGRLTRANRRRKDVPAVADPDSRLCEAVGRLCRAVCARFARSPSARASATSDNKHGYADEEQHDAQNDRAGAASVRRDERRDDCEDTDSCEP